MRLLMAYLVAALLTGGAALAQEARPQRVVSSNLCTDQLAMLIAGEGQLHSVSRLAADPFSSAMAKQSEAFVTNHGSAEEIYLMRPDLVLAGSYTTPATKAMLRRLGIPVEVFAPAKSLEDVRAAMRRMGVLLHRQSRAEALIDAFDRRLARLRRDVAQRPEAVLYQANGYTLGDSTLAGRILSAAGFENAASRAGYAAGARMPLEVLVMTAPDLVITAQPYPGGSRAEEVMRHPAVDAFRRGRAGAAVTDHDWICGTPHVLRAIETLAETRRALDGATQ